MNYRQLFLEEMQAYTTDHLTGISPDEFQQYILSLIDNSNPNKTSIQRDEYFGFVWGHNHDFGTFKVSGYMGDRHIDIPANFLGNFDLSLSDIQNKNILDVGVWTGGSSLLLAALGNSVWAIEEVKRYAETAKYLIDVFDVYDISIHAISLYKINVTNKFDIVNLAGVIYHVTDPILALRILFNSLKDNGLILVESAGVNGLGSMCYYEGCEIGTWNWFIPSQGALQRMMEDVGFQNVEVKFIGDRLYAVGRKIQQVDMSRCGISRSDIL